jgi:FtsZ-binding cell division protein ZapB
LAEQQAEVEVSTIRDSKGLEGIFKTLWDRVRRAAELIDYLKEENRTLQGNCSRLEEQTAKLRKELMEKEETLREVKEQHLEAISHNNNFFSEEEKQALKSRIKELLGRINTHI